MLIDLNKREHQESLKEVLLYCMKHPGDTGPKLAAAIEGLKYCAASFLAEQSSEEDHREAHSYLLGVM
jgi:hypothetical protein